MGNPKLSTALLRCIFAASVVIALVHGWIGFLGRNFVTTLLTILRWGRHHFRSCMADLHRHCCHIQQGLHARRLWTATCATATSSWQRCATVCCRPRSMPRNIMMHITAAGVSGRRLGAAPHPSSASSVARSGFPRQAQSALCWTISGGGARGCSSLSPPTARRRPHP